MSAIIPKQYYQDWRSVGYQYNAISPILQGGKLIFTFRFPFFISSLLTTYNVPDGGSPVYANAGLLSLTGAQNNTYKDMLFAMFIAMCYANRDVDNPDGITEYEGLPGNDFSGYFKNYLNEKLLATNFYTFMSWPSYTRNRLLVNAGATNTALFNSEMTYLQQSFPGFNKKFMGAPGTYSLTYDGVSNVAPYSAGLNAYNTALTIASLKLLVFELKPIE